MKKIFVAVLFHSSVINASDKPYYFYNPDQEYGSELRFNPLTLWVNGSFDILRNGGHSKDIFNQPYKVGCENVVQNITHPFANIKEYGVKDFLHPTYQLFNEIFENGSFEGTNVDPISDMLIDWSLQPYYNPNNRFLENAGQQFASKLKLGKKSRYSLFFYWGVLSTGGFSYNLDDERTISFSAGAIVNKINENRFRNACYMTPDLDYVISFFYDRSNSLLLSTYLTGPKFYNLRVDIYPGLVEVGDFKPGFFLGAGEMDGLQFGLMCSFLPVGILGQFVDPGTELN